MSQTIFTVVPNIDTSLQHKNLFIEGSSEFLIQQINTDNYSNNASTFQINVPGKTSFMDRFVMYYQPVLLTFTGTTNDGGNLLRDNLDSLRSYPMSSIMPSIKWQSQNQSFDYDAQHITYALSHYWDSRHEQLFPSFNDTYASYSDPLMVGAINNPLGCYYNCIERYHTTRGAYAMTITSNTPTSASVLVNIREPIICPFTHKDPMTGLGLSNQDSLSLTLQYNSSNLQRIWSHAPSAGVTSFNLAVTIQKPYLFVTFSSPPYGYVPRPLTYACDSVIQVSRTLSSIPLAPNGHLDNVTSGDYQLNAVPQWLLINVGDADTYKTMSTSDCALAIDHLEIIFNSRSGILSSSTKEELYAISKSNGLQDTFEEFSGLVNTVSGRAIGTKGSFIKLVFGKDIPLASGLWPGKVSKYDLQVRLNVTNTNQINTITLPTIYTTFSYINSLEYQETGNVVSNFGIPEPQTPTHYIAYSKAQRMYGGSFLGDALSKVMGFLKPVGQFVKDNKLISGVSGLLGMAGVPFANQISGVATKMGLGDGDGDGGMQAFGDGKGKHKKHRGGEVLTRQDLVERLNNL